MKKILYIISAFVLSMTISSCSAGWLDTSDPSEKSDEIVVDNLTSAKTAMNGVYYMIKGSSSYNQYYGAAMIYYGDIKGDIIQSTETGTRGAWNYTLTTITSNNASNMTYIPYKVINRANSLIQMLENGNAKDATQAQVDDLIGQCKIARALAHFDLLRIYSKFWDANSMGMPIVTKVENYNFAPKREAVGDVFSEVVIPDLEFAINNCNSNNGQGYFNKWTAQLILARAYQYQGNDQLAYETATDLITKSPYRLWSHEAYANGFQLETSNQANTEALFQILMTGNTDWTDREGIAYLYNSDGYYIGHATYEFYMNIKENYADDCRSLLLVSEDVQDGSASKEGYTPVPEISDGSGENEKEGDYTSSTPIWINKYMGIKSDDNRISAITLFRLSEAYFIASESAFKLDKTQDAADYLNVIIERGNPNATQVTAGDITLDKILDEKAVEFYGEGHRYFDLIRNEKQIIRYNSDHPQVWQPIITAPAQVFDRNATFAIMPIPQDDMNANPNMIQNPGY